MSPVHSREKTPMQIVRYLTRARVTQARGDKRGARKTDTSGLIRAFPENICH